MEDFVTFEIAKKLKEKGFIGNGNIGCCCGFYCEEGFNINIVYDDLDNSELLCNEYLRPSISQVLKWLREEKHLEANGCYVYEEQQWLGYVCEMDIPNVNGFHTLEYHKSYEDATLSAIEYVLDNLI